MDKRGWLWKKKSSDKTATATEADNGYVKISVESHSYLLSLEDQVKSLESEVTQLNDKLSSAQSEITAKDDAVKQHAKVAGEAVAGWEKAEAEAATLRQQLDSVKLERLTAEERASHFDDALKECMKQMQKERNENEQKLQDTIFAKTKQWERIKFDLESDIANCERDIMGASAENEALRRSLQESADELFKAGEAKSQLEAEIEFLNSKIKSCEKEVNSLQYELQIMSKEIEICNEEKNMSMRVADTANKQHLEDAKKINKLEAECQKLRGLLRKKLPGPAMIAQIKQEVETLGLHGTEKKVRQTHSKTSSPRQGSESEFSFNKIEHVRRENEFLAARLLTMEEEMKMLKEALSDRNNELLAARELYAKTAGKLHSTEARTLDDNQTSSFTKGTSASLESSRIQNACSPPSFTSMSEDGIDEEFSSESCTSTVVTPEFSQFAKEKYVARSTKDQKDASTEELQSSKAPASILLSGLASRIASLLESQALDSTIRKLLEDMRHVLRSTREDLLQHCVSLMKEGDASKDSACVQEPSHEGKKEIANSVLATKESHVTGLDISEDLGNALTSIHDFVFSLSRKAMETNGPSSGTHKQINNLEELGASMKRVLKNEASLSNFILVLSRLLSEISDMGQKTKADENSDDFIDKVTLLERKIGDNELGRERISEGSQNSPACSPKLVQDEIFEQLKLEKGDMNTDLANTKLQLAETERHLEELKLKLAASENSNSMAETQLKCMVESYRSLESRSQELEAEIKELRVKVEDLESELGEERQSHQEDLAKTNDLQAQIERLDGCSRCKCNLASDLNGKREKELEIAAATEKLAECQETIILLGRQLKAMNSSTEFVNPSIPSPSGRHRIGDILKLDKCDSLIPLNCRRTDELEVDKVVSLSQNEGDTTAEPLKRSSDVSSSDAVGILNTSSSNSSKIHKQKNRPSSTSSFSRLFSKGKNEN